jgi:hypothetical protein
MNNSAGNNGAEVMNRRNKLPDNETEYGRPMDSNRELTATIPPRYPDRSRLAAHGSADSLLLVTNRREKLGGTRIAYLSSTSAPPRKLLWLLLSVICATQAQASSRLKTDVVFMKNGDKITCEIRSLEQGQLTIKQDYANSTVVFDWGKVDHIQTHQPFVVVDNRGDATSGSISENTDEHIVNVNGAVSKNIPHDEVVSIQQTGETFTRRLRGDVDLGLSFAQSNAQKNLTLEGDLTYQATTHLASATSSSQFSSQKETNDTNETTVKTEYFNQLRRSDWYGGAIANFLSSSEQQIDLRSTLGGAIAIRPIYTNKSNLSLIAGLAFTSEKDKSNSESTANKRGLDSAIAAQFSTFRFDSTTFDTTLWVYPSLTTPGRVRMTLNQDVYYKFYKDFYIRASFYDNYDNRPVVGAPQNNLGLSSTVGWSFR